MTAACIFRMGIRANHPEKDLLFSKTLFDVEDISQVLVCSGILTDHVFDTDNILW